MQPFGYQVKSTAVHSLGAIEGVRRGIFSPDTTKPPASFAALNTRVADTLAGLAVIQPSEVDAFVGREMRFVAGDRQLAFTAGNFTGQLRTKRDSAGVPMRAWADPESGASSFEYRGQ